MAVNSRMRPRVLKFIITVGILTALALIVGCSGDDDVLDEEGSRFYTTGIDVSDNNSTTTDIDMFGSVCVAPATEAITKSTMTPTFVSSASSTRTGYVFRIDVDFTRVSFTGPGAAPELTDFSLTGLALPILPGGSSSADEYDLITLVEKADYSGTYDPAGIAVFNVTVTALVTFTPGSIDEDVRMPPFSFQITVANFNNCS